MARTAASAPYRTRAIVLRVRALGEKDRVLHLLSPERGRFSAAARGARGGKSKLAAVAQPFILARFLLAHGRSLDMVTQAEIENAHIHLALHLQKSAWATYLCEMCDSLPEDLPESEIFELLETALAHLDQAPEERWALEMIGRWSEARFLTLLGYAPMLGRCAVCEIKINAPPEPQTQRLDFSPALGGNLCPQCAPRDPQRLTVSVTALRALHKIGRAAAPPDAAQLPLSSAQWRELRDCLRRSLMMHLDLKLKSQRFLDDVLEEWLMPQSTCSG